MHFSPEVWHCVWKRVPLPTLHSTIRNAWDSSYLNIHHNVKVHLYPFPVHIFCSHIMGMEVACRCWSHQPLRPLKKKKPCSTHLFSKRRQTLLWSLKKTNHLKAVSSSNGFVLPWRLPLHGVSFSNNPFSWRLSRERSDHIWMGDSFDFWTLVLTKRNARLVLINLLS